MELHKDWKQPKRKLKKISNCRLFQPACLRIANLIRVDQRKDCTPQKQAQVMTRNALHLFQLELDQLTKSNA